MWRFGLAKKAERILGPRAILDRHKELKVYEFGDAASRTTPIFVCLPETSQQISRIVQIVAERGLPIVTTIGHQWRNPSAPARNAVWIDLARMNKIVEIDAANLRAVVEPAVAIGDMNSALHPLGLRVAGVDSLSVHNLNVNGLNVDGFNVHNLNDGNTLKELVDTFTVVGLGMVMGMEVVLASGRIARIGGKADDTAGYDLLGTFVRAGETFGIIARMTIRLNRVDEPELPWPARAWGLSPSAAEGISSGEAELLRRLKSVLDPNGVLYPQDTRGGAGSLGNAISQDKCPKTDSDKSRNAGAL